LPSPIAQLRNSWNFISIRSCGVSLTFGNRNCS
jgi:hypothetical protein